MSKNRDLNLLVVEGRLTRDPELSTLPSGTSVCDLRIAVNRGEDKDGADLGAYFFDVKVWNGQGESCANYLTKGRAIRVQGKLAYREWEKDGVKQSRVFVVAEPFGVKFGPRPQGDGSSTPDESFAPAEQTEDIPF